MHVRDREGGERAQTRHVLENCVGRSKVLPGKVEQRLGGRGGAAAVKVGDARADAGVAQRARELDGADPAARPREGQTPPDRLQRRARRVEARRPRCVHELLQAPQRRHRRGCGHTRRGSSIGRRRREVRPEHLRVAQAAAPARVARGCCHVAHSRCAEADAHRAERAAALLRARLLARQETRDDVPRDGVWRVLHGGGAGAAFTRSCSIQPSFAAASHEKREKGMERMRVKGWGW